MKKILFILFLALILTSCYMPPRFMQMNPYYDNGYHSGSNTRYTSTNNSADLTNQVAKDLDGQINMIIKNQKTHAGEKLTLTVEFYASNQNVDDKKHEELVDKISYHLFKLNKDKYDIIYPDYSTDEALKEEGLQTNETKPNELEKNLMKEYDPGIQIFVVTGKLSADVIEITAKMSLRTTGKEVFNKTYKVYPQAKQNNVNTNNSSRITTTYYEYSAPVFAPAYYYWDYPHYYYWGWSYPHYRYSYSYWRHRPYYRTYRSYPSKTQRPSSGYYHK